MYSLLNIKEALLAGQKRVYLHHWMRRDPPPPMIVKRSGCTAIHNKALSLIHHAFIQSYYSVNSNLPNITMVLQRLGGVFFVLRNTIINNGNHSIPVHVQILELTYFN